MFEEVLGASTAKFALHDDWIDQKGYEVDGVVNLNLPEQGINGPFRIISIRHILPQKKPTDEDEGDDYDYRPVTALFTHESDQVYDIGFDNGESLGITYQHPIFSLSIDNWKLAEELQIGERILTHKGEAKVVSIDKKFGSEVVYNLEVKDLHNFLVANSGIVVHNSYFDEAWNFLNNMSPNDMCNLISDAWAVGFPWWFHRGRFMEEILGQSKFASWIWTGAISSNFPLVDCQIGRR